MLLIRNLLPVTAVELGNPLSRDLYFLLVAKREEEERDESTRYADCGHPPDVPDQRKAGNDGKESRDEAGCAAFRHFDRFVLARLCGGACFACMRCLLAQKASISPTRGRTA